MFSHLKRRLERNTEVRKNAERASAGGSHAFLIAYGYFLMKKTDEFLEENSEYEEASENGEKRQLKKKWKKYRKYSTLQREEEKWNDSFLKVPVCARMQAG